MARNRRKILKHREAAFCSQGGRCYYCAQPMWLNDVREYCTLYGFTPSRASAFRCTAEHLLARRDGGRDEPENIVAACFFCNRHRHARPQPLEPQRYKAHVRGRVFKGRWHGTLVLAKLADPSFEIGARDAAGGENKKCLHTVTTSENRTIFRPTVRATFTYTSITTKAKAADCSGAIEYRVWSQSLALGSSIKAR